jgi:hypothetical protein
MKYLHEPYTFNPPAKTVTLNGTTGSLSLEHVLLVTNVSSGSIIYNFADPSAIGTYDSPSGTLTLAYDTTAMRSNDKLQIFVDNGSLDASEQSVVELQEHTILLRKLLKVLESNTIVDTGQRQRVMVDTGSIVTTVSTVTAVTAVATVSSAQVTGSISNLSLVPTHENQIQWSRNTWANCIRNKLDYT